MGKQDKQYDEDGLVIRTNKEDEKRKREAIKTFVKEQLLALSNDKYAVLPLDNTLQAALIEAKRLSGNAYKRHLAFLVRLVYEQDFAAIQAAFARIHHPYRNDPGKIREIEHYRERLIAGDKAVINELLAKFAQVNIQYLRQLARNAGKERQAERQRLIDMAAQGGEPFDENQPVKPTKSAKLLYQYLFKLELL